MKKCCKQTRKETIKKCIERVSFPAPGVLSDEMATGWNRACIVTRNNINELLKEKIVK